MKVTNNSARAVYVLGTVLVPGAVTEVPGEDAEIKATLKGIDGIEFGGKSKADEGDMTDAQRVATTVSPQVAPHSGDAKLTEKAQDEAKNAKKDK